MPNNSEQKQSDSPDKEQSDSPDKEQSDSQKKNNDFQFQKRQVYNYLAIILIAGFLGGFVSYVNTLFTIEYCKEVEVKHGENAIEVRKECTLRVESKSSESKSSESKLPKVDWFGFNFNYFILNGIVAAFCIPFLLKIISSEIFKINRARDEEGYYKNYFIFGSLCLIVALFASEYINYTNAMVKKSLNVDNSPQSGLDSLFKAQNANPTEITKTKQNSKNIINNDQDINDVEKDKFEKTIDEFQSKLYKPKAELTRDAKITEKELGRLKEKNIIKEIKVNDSSIVILDPTKPEEKEDEQ